jgi:hypothetical protein
LGRTAATYQVWAQDTTLVVDKNGRLAAVIVCSQSNPGSSTFTIGKNGAIVRNWVEDEFSDGGLERDSSIDSLITALEATLGLPSSRRAIPKPIAAPPQWPSVAKGKVIDRDGHPVAGAKVLSFADVRRKFAATTGPAGDFVYNFREGDRLWPIMVEASGVASRGFRFRLKGEGEPETADPRAWLIEPSGIVPEPLVVGPGVTVAGRVVRDGKPVEGASIGLSFADRDDSPSLAGIPAITTDARGSFRFLHVLPDTAFWAYSKVGSIDDQGTIVPESVHTTEDGTTVELGDLQIEKGRTLAGRLVTADSKPVPGGTTFWASIEHTGGSVELRVSDTGQFEWKGLPDGLVTLKVVFRAAPAELGYRVSAQNKCLSPFHKNLLEGRLDHDITDLTILLEPDRGSDPEFRSLREVDPALAADFNDAKAGPITGVPPRP